MSDMPSVESVASDCMAVFVPETYLRHISNIRKIARLHGYAIAVHGSLSRDIDLIAVPWVADARDPSDLAESLREVVDGHFSQTLSGEHLLGDKPHGRLGCCINVGNGVYFDLSIMPPKPPNEPASPAVEKAMARFHGAVAMREKLESQIKKLTAERDDWKKRCCDMADEDAQILADAGIDLTAPTASEPVCEHARGCPTSYNQNEEECTCGLRWRKQIDELTIERDAAKAEIAIGTRYANEGKELHDKHVARIRELESQNVAASDELEKLRAELASVRQNISREMTNAREAMLENDDFLKRARPA